MWFLTIYNGLSFLHQKSMADTKNGLTLHVGIFHDFLSSTDFCLQILSPFRSQTFLILIRPDVLSGLGTNCLLT